MKSKSVDTKSLSASELNAKCNELYKERFSLTMQLKSGQEGVKTHRLKQIRRDIARIKTALGQVEA